MRIDLYHLCRYPHFTTPAHPIALEALGVWANSVGWDVRLATCGEAEVDLTIDAQVVGFSVYTQTAPAAYRPAEKSRDKGKIVILGGPHLRGSATHFPSVPTSIGCPYDCAYCNPYMHGEYILRDIETVRGEVALIRGKTVFLWDATFGPEQEIYH